MSYCNWEHTSEINRRYHDEEWGIPVHDDRKQFEFLMLEVMQCGLSWNTVINKRDVFRQCFDDFDYDKIALYDESDVARIMATPGMIKSPRKIAAIINNAACYRKLRAEFESFSRYLWSYSNGKTIIYDKHGNGNIPSSNGLSDRISRDLKKRGFKYLGSIVIYSHLQACGIINDHDVGCPRYDYINSRFPIQRRRRYLEKDVKNYSAK